MSMIDAYCVDDLVIVRHVGYDQYNQPVPDSGSASASGSGSGAGIPVKGYIVWKTQLVRDQKGEEVTSSVMVYLPSHIERDSVLGRELTHEDRIQIGGETFDRAIVAIARPKAFARPHYEIYLA